MLVPIISILNDTLWLTIHIYLPFKFYTDKPDAPLNIRIPPEDIKHDSFIVQWDAVTDVFPITYTVRWYGEDINNTNTTNELSYTVTGLTSNTSYSVTVVAINTCCGTGPVSDVMTATTSSSQSISLNLFF